MAAAATTRAPRSPPPPRPARAPAPPMPARALKAAGSRSGSRGREPPSPPPAAAVGGPARGGRWWRGERDVPPAPAPARGQGAPAAWAARGAGGGAAGSSRLAASCVVAQRDRLPTRNVSVTPAVGRGGARRGAQGPPRCSASPRAPRRRLGGLPIPSEPGSKLRVVGTGKRASKHARV